MINHIRSQNTKILQKTLKEYKKKRKERIHTQKAKKDEMIIKNVPLLNSLVSLLDMYVWTSLSFLFNNNLSY